MKIEISKEAVIFELSPDSNGEARHLTITPFKMTLNPSWQISDVIEIGKQIFFGKYAWLPIRKLKAKWAPEGAKDFSAYHAKKMADELAKEIDRDMNCGVPIPKIRFRIGRKEIE